MITKTDNVFVGRESELDFLFREFSITQSGELRIVFLSGEGGTGKTALVSEFSQRARQVLPNMIYQYIRCTPEGESSGLLPFVHLIKQLYEIQISQAVNKKKIKKALTVILKVAPAWLNLTFWGIPSAALETVQELKKYIRTPFEAPIYSDTHVFDQFSKLLTHKAAEAPLVIVFDDIHWMDESSLDLLLSLSRKEIRQPVLIICTFRNSLAIRKPYFEPAYLEILSVCGKNLSDLAVGINVKEYADERFPVHRFPPDFLEKVQHVTQGYPLFVQELFTLFADQGHIYEIRNPQTNEVVETVLDQAAQETIQIPHKVEAVIEKRIASLEKKLMEILEVASVEGEDFTVEVITNILKMEENKRDAVRALDDLDKQHKLIVEIGERSTSRDQIISQYQFSHRFIRDFIYERLSTSMRRILHGLICECLEEIYADDIAQAANQLVFHASLAGDKEKSIQYSLVAAKNEYARYSWKEAANFAKHVYDLTREKAESENLYVNEIIEAILIEEKSESNLGNYQALLPRLFFCLELAEKQRDKAGVIKIMTAISDVYYWTGNHDAEAYTEQVVALAEGYGDRQLIFEAKYMLNAIYDDAVGKHRKARQIANELIELASSFDDPYPEIDSICILGWSNISFGRYQEGINNCLDALTRLQRLENPSPVFVNMANRFLGLAYQGAGQHEKSLEHMQTALSEYQKSGEQNFVVLCWIEIGETMLERQHIAKARDYFEKSISLGKTTANSDAIIWSGIDLGKVSIKENDYPSAEKYLQDAREELENVQYLDAEIDLRLTAAELNAARSNWQEAEMNLSKTAELLAQTDSNVYRLPYLLLLSKVNASQGRLSEAESACLEALNLADDVDSILWQAKARQALGAVKDQSGKHEDAWEQFNLAYDLFQSLNHLWELDGLTGRLIEVGTKTGWVAALSKEYQSRYGVPIISYVDLSIFTHQYFGDCLECTTCGDACCSYGVDIDITNLRRITRYASSLEAYTQKDRKQWFDGDIQNDPEYPGGKFTRTKVIDGKCSFANRTGRGCRLQTFCLENGIDYHEMKPMVSCLFPITFSWGLLHPSSEVRLKELACLGPGKTLYQGIREEIGYYFGEELVEELDSLSNPGLPLG
jgi:tetratricopeptide (TPR) repeat protein